MPKNPQSDLIKGTLDMLILRAVEEEALHGFAIARRIQASSNDHLRVEEGSLYPALHRMERRGWIDSHWGLSENNRRAKYYRITRAGRTQFKAEVARWDEMVEAISSIIHSSQREDGHALG